MAYVLIIDDERSVCLMLAETIMTMGHTADYTHTLKQGLEMAATCEFDVILLDVRMPDGSGLDIISKFREKSSAPEVIIITGFGDQNGAELAIKSGAWDYIQKPVFPTNIRLPLKRVFQYRENLRAVQKQYQNISFDGIIGTSRCMKTCLDLTMQAAKSDAGVLLTGETGTGKDLFANTIHKNSVRSQQNFVVVDCAALPETLVESVLFGHEKGAFTSADTRQDGLILQADQGTLFLDEIGELPLSIQKTFLRVLEEQRFRPIGSSKEKQSRFRLIAATNRNLDIMAKNGKFRLDLLFRIQAINIELPPLRTHPDDIRDIAIYHLEKLCRNYGINIKDTSSDFMEFLAAYPWPGNVRELIHTLHSTLAVAHEEPVLFPAHLPSNIRIHIARSSVQLVSENPAIKNSGRPLPDDPLPALPDSFSDTLPPFKEFKRSAFNQIEKDYLLKLMKQAKGSIKDSCHIAGLSRTRLYNLMKKHGVSRLGW